MPRINVLTDRDVLRLREMAKADRKPPLRQQPGRPTADTDGPTVLIFRVPAGGIPARTADQISYGDCTTLRIRRDDGSLLEMPGTRRLWNVLDRPLAADEELVAHRDAWGFWLPGTGMADCPEATWSTGALLPTGDPLKLGLFTFHHAMRWEAGCPKVKTWTEGPSALFDCCEREPCEDGEPTLTLAHRCSEDAPGFTGWVGIFLEIVSLTASATTVSPGDEVTFTLVYKLREDIESTEGGFLTEATVGQVCGDGGVHDPAECFGCTSLFSGGWGAIVDQTRETVECFRVGETYTYTVTIRFDVTNCERTGWVAFTIGVGGRACEPWRYHSTSTAPCNGIQRGGCSQVAHDAFIFTDTGTGWETLIGDELPDGWCQEFGDPFPGPEFPTECDGSSSGSSSSSGSTSSSGSEPSGSGSGSLSEPSGSVSVDP